MLLRLIELLAERYGYSPCDMRFGELRLQLERLLAGGVGLSEVRFACVEIRVKKGAAIRHARVRERVVGIDLDGTIEHLPRVLETFSSKLMEELSAAQVKVVGLKVDHARLLDRLLLVFAENYAE